MGANLNGEANFADIGIVGVGVDQERVFIMQQMKASSAQRV